MQPRLEEMSHGVEALVATSSSSLRSGHRQTATTAAALETQCVTTSTSLRLLMFMPRGGDERRPTRNRLCSGAFRWGVPIGRVWPKRQRQSWRRCPQTSAVMAPLPQVLAATAPAVSCPSPRHQQLRYQCTHHRQPHGKAAGDQLAAGPRLQSRV